MSSGSTIDRKARATCSRPVGGTRGLPNFSDVIRKPDYRWLRRVRVLSRSWRMDLETAFDHAHEDPVSPHKVMVKRGALDAL